NKPMLPANEAQADVPDVCRVLFNNFGTAPGMWFEQNGKIVIPLPGVPAEMQHILEQSVFPLLNDSWMAEPILHKHLLTVGIGESFLASKIEDLESALPPYIRLAYLPNYGSVKLRLTTHGSVHRDIEKEITDWQQKIKNRIEENVIAEEDLKIEDVLGRLLLDKKLNVATAE